MATIQPTSFTTPMYDYGAELSQIQRRQALAAALQQQGMQQTQDVPTAGPGQFQAQSSPFQGLAKMAEVYAGARQQKKAEEKQRLLAEKAQADLTNVLTNAQKAALGTPGTPLSEDAAGNVTPAQAAIAPNPMAAASLYMQHPMTAPLGQAMAQKEIDNQARQRMLADLMKGGNQPSAAAAGGTAPSYGQPGFAPQGQPNGVFAGMPPQLVALMTSGDPELVKLGTTLMEARKGVAQRPGAPVVNPFTGEIIAQAPPAMPQGIQVTGGPQGFSANVVPGFGQAQEQLRSIPDPSHGLISIKTSSGQEIQLTQPEYLNWQRTGQLPQRFGGSPANQPTPSNPVPAAQPVPQSGFRVPGAPGLGIIGAGQSQQDIIQQARQQAGGKALDEQFAKDYATFVQGGAADSAKQLAQLQDVAKALRAPGANLTGPTLGNIPDTAKNFINPQSVAMRERVEEVVQRSLRAILGAQFTEKEGERLIARAYNPRLSEAENAIRVDRLFTQLNNAFQQKKAAAQYFERNGTLEGWRGKLPSISDFDPDAGSTDRADPLGIRK